MDASIETWKVLQLTVLTDSCNQLKKAHKQKSITVQVAGSNLEPAESFVKSCWYKLYDDHELYEKLEQHAKAKTKHVLFKVLLTFGDSI